MKTISYSEYELIDNFRKYIDVLVKIDLPRIFLIKMAIEAAKLSQHLIEDKNKEFCLSIIDKVENLLYEYITEKDRRDCDEESRMIFHFNDKTIAGEAAYFASYAVHDLMYALIVPTTIGTASHATSAMHNAWLAINTINTEIGFSESRKINFFRQIFPWNICCAAQIATAINQTNNEEMIRELSENQQLIDYATVVLGTENLRNEFNFLMQNYIINHTKG